jgi:hypothetical protein
MEVIIPKFIKEIKKQHKYRLYSLVALFTIFLTPFSFMVRGDNVSVNYSFVLFPIFLLLTGGKLKAPIKSAQTLISIYIIIFITCFIYQNYYIQFWERRFISFFIFMSLFTFFIVEIDKQMMKAFKYSIILVSIIYSLNSLYTYFSNGGMSLGFEGMRPIVQSQRYGFVLLFGFWLTIFFKTKSTLGICFKMFAIFVIFNGLGLTFSRSSVAGLLASSSALCAMFILKIIKEPIKNLPNKLIKPIIYSSLITVIIILSYQLIPDYFQFFSERLLGRSITPILSEGFNSYPKFPRYDTYVYNQLESSEGYRIFMITEILKYLTSNPLFGSGYLGVWVMFDDLSGASHNQLLDVLFRTGVVGFAGFLFILYYIVKYNFVSQNMPVLITIIGILAIGLFHETFKLSQGAFIFSFLAAHALHSINNRTQKP